MLELSHKPVGVTTPVVLHVVPVLGVSLIHLHPCYTEHSWKQGEVSRLVLNPLHPFPDNPHEPGEPSLMEKLLNGTYFNASPAFSRFPAHLLPSPPMVLPIFKDS